MLEHIYLAFGAKVAQDTENVVFNLLCFDYCLYPDFYSAKSVKWQQFYNNEGHFVIELTRKKNLDSWLISLSYL
jgi:hypothetical protein